MAEHGYGPRFKPELGFAPGFAILPNFGLRFGLGFSLLRSSTGLGTATMTAADFQALALALHRTRATIQTVQAIANVCEASNPHFHRGTFLRASGHEMAAKGWETLNPGKVAPRRYRHA